MADPTSGSDRITTEKRTSDAASLLEAEALVGMLVGPAGKTARGAANMLALALAVIITDHPEAIGGGGPDQVAEVVRRMHGLLPQLRQQAEAAGRPPGPHSLS